MAVKQSQKRAPARDPLPAARQPRPAKVEKPAKPRAPRNHDRLTHELLGIGAIALALILVDGLAFQRRAGALVDFLTGTTLSLAGVGAYAFPILLIVVGAALIAAREQQTRAHFPAGLSILFVIFICWWQTDHTRALTQFAHVQRHGGYIGAVIVAGLRLVLNDIAIRVILAAITCMTLIWAIDMRFLQIVGHGIRFTGRVTGPVVHGGRSVARQAAEAKRRSEAAKQEREARRLEREAQKPVKAVSIPAPEPPRTVKPAPLKRERPITSASVMQLPFEPDDDGPTMPRIVLTAPPDAVADSRSTPAPVALPAVQIPEALGADGTRYEFVLPPLTLLKEVPPPPVKQERATEEKQAILMQTLNDFKIGANVSQVAMGPTITRYEVQLDPGILVKKIVSLADNLTMSLSAIDVRIEAPIPGKNAIGIEVPNDVIHTVTLRECLSTTEFMTAPSKLTFALGKDVGGAFKYADLTRMPHLLIGGSTNSGKSVCLNVLISSILYRATPREVKFVMVDPKRVELSLYDGIPHLLAPVIKDVKQAAGIFRSVLKEMDERYDRFAHIGTRNIEGFNNRVPPEERLPFIVVVVDELADLMMQQGPEVEMSICRLAQLARATGIHLVLATQRPSVDVVTGTIKANISSRIAFTVATQIDSRTIIDMPGADRLIGRGDMLFMPIDAAKPVRIQGCYIGERETDELVKYLRDQEEAVYTMIPSETSASGMDGPEDDGSSDELFEPCVRWLLIQGQCSTSSLQRKFKIGYTRAARLVEVMEARGIVSSQDGVKPREILLRPENLEAFFAGKGQGDLGQY